MRMAVAGKSQCLAISESKYVSYDTTSSYAGTSFRECPLLALSGQNSRLSVCPLLDNNGQRWILARNGLSANDPNQAYKEEEGPLRVALAAIPPTPQPRV